MRSLAPLLLFFSAGSLAGLAGCVNTDPNVFVAPTITSPTAALDTSSPLGLGLKGSFDLGLDLSPRAVGPSTVKLSQLNVLDAKMNPVLQAVGFTSSPSFPTIVQPGDDPTVTVTFDEASGTVPQTSETSICGGVVIEAVITDSLETTGMAKTAHSDMVPVGNCPK